MDIAAGRLLMQATASGDAEAVRFHLAAGAPVDFVDATGTTALHLAVSDGLTGVVSVLLRGGAAIDARTSLEGGGGTPLHLAILSGQPDMAATLIQAGADVDAEEFGSGKTPLILAAEHGLLSVAAELLAAGCDEERCDADGFNAAFWAKHKRLAGWECLGGAPAARAPSMEEVLLDLGQRRMAMVAVGAKLVPAKKPKASKKPSKAKAR